MKFHRRLSRAVSVPAVEGLEITRIIHRHSFLVYTARHGRLRWKVQRQNGQT